MSYRDGGMVNDGTIYGEIAKSTPYIHGAPPPPITQPDAMPGWSSLVTSPVFSNTGAGSAMAIKADNSLWGWGQNSTGVLGTGNTERVATPIKLMDDVLAADISGTSYVLKTDGSLWVSGEFWENTGNPEPHSQRSIILATRKKIMDGVSSASIDGRSLHAVKTDGSLWRWRGNVDREPERITDGVISVVTTGSNTGFVIRTDGSLWNLISTGIGAKVMDSVASATTHSGTHYAIRKDGSLWAWGSNRDLGHGYGYLGDGTTQNRAEPVKILDGVAFVAPGGGSVFAVKTDGTLWAWGLNSSGPLGPDEIGYGNFAPIGSSHSGSSTPIHIMTGDRFVYAAARNAVKTDGSVWSWSNTTALPFQVADGLKLTPPASLLGGGTTPPPTSGTQAIPYPNVGVTLDGAKVPVEVYGIDGRTFLKLSDLAIAVGISATWDGAVQLDSTKPAGSSSPSGTLPTGPVEATPYPNIKVFLNGTEIPVDVYGISGSTVLGLGDVARALGLTATWDGATSTAVLTR